MQISFNIADDVGAEFLLAAKDFNNDPALTDTQNINKCLKKQIARIIDVYHRKLAIGALEDNVNSLNEQMLALRLQLGQAQQTLAIQENNLNIAPANVT